MALLLLLLCLLFAATTQAFVPPLSKGKATPAAARRWTLPALPSTASDTSDAATAGTSSSSETVLWLRGLSNTFDGTRYQFKDISLSLQKGACVRHGGDDLIGIDPITSCLHPSISTTTHQTTLNAGQKVGLVGVNGSGKSTLLRVIGGVDKAESGQIETQKGLQVVYVDQEPSFPPGTKVQDVMFDPKGSPAMAAVREYQLASLELAEGTEKAYDRFQRASQAMDAVGAWEAETVANQVYTQLGVMELQDKLVENLSGGERKRLGLAASLVRKPDVILMDEVRASGRLARLSHGVRPLVVLD